LGSIGSSVLLANAEAVERLAQTALVANLAIDGRRRLVRFLCGSRILQIVGDVPQRIQGVRDGNGDGTFRPPVLYDAGAGIYGSPAIPVLGDFNGDGALDIATPYSAVNDASASIEVLLNTGGTTISLSSSANPSGAGKPVTFTAKVTESVLVLNSSLPAGSVIFKDGSTTLASVPLSSGSAVFTTSALASGSHKITATYTGNSHYNRHGSAVLTQIVQ
jgi:hypothetical protein